jgi:hypothetical protein
MYSDCACAQFARLICAGSLEYERLALVSIYCVTNCSHSNHFHLRMASSVMLPHVALVRTDAPEERSASIIRVTRIG